MVPLDQTNLGEEENLKDTIDSSSTQDEADVTKEDQETPAPQTPLQQLIEKRMQDPTIQAQVSKDPSQADSLKSRITQEVTDLTPDEVSKELAPAPQAPAPVVQAPAAKPTSAQAPIAKPAPVSSDPQVARIQQSAPKSKSPVDIDSTANQLKALMPGLSAERQKIYQDEFSKLDSIATDLKKEYKENKERIDQARLFETFGQAAAKLAAGYQGLKTGVDVSSGLKFDKTNWQDDYKNALDEFKTGLEDVKERRQVGKTALSHEQTTQAAKEETAARGAVSLKESSDRLAEKKAEFLDKMNQRKDALTQLDKQDHQAALKQQAAWEAETVKREKAINDVSNIIASKNDYKKKDKYEEDLNRAMKDANISPQQMQDAEAAATTPGKFFGTNYDPKAHGKALQSSLMQDINAEKQAQKASRAQLMGGAPAATPAASQPAPAKPAAAASPDDQAAKDWLSKNPSDPRAPKIRQQLQAKGLI